ncbi:hypothetical protein [Candidatus Lucifugimonas marina]
MASSALAWAALIVLSRSLGIGVDIETTYLIFVARLRRFLLFAGISGST